MSMVDEQPMEILHLYIIPEDQLPKKPDYPSLLLVLGGLLCMLALVGISVFSAVPPQEVSFTVSIAGFHLAPASKTLQTSAMATGKGHTQATDATGMITFYNGLTYTQIVPVGTKLTGSDGVSVLTDEQAIIPPAAQTNPPTYGHTSVPAHALVPGMSGNIHAGDINIPCCATSIIAQNPSTFTGGRNARNFTYLTQQDVTQTIGPLLPTLRASTLSLLPPPRLHPQCSPVIHSSPGVGKETQRGVLTIVETCSAVSYSVQSAVRAITIYSQRFGKGMLAPVQFFAVGVTGQKGVILTLYVMGQWHPLLMRRFPGTGK